MSTKFTKDMHYLTLFYQLYLEGKIDKAELKRRRFKLYGTQES